MLRNPMLPPSQSRPKPAQNLGFTGLVSSRLTYVKHAIALYACAVMVLLGGCGGTQTAQPRTTVEPEPITHEHNPGDTSASETPQRKPDESDSTDKPANSLDGVTIALDPGHNGGNASHLSRINKKVPDGRGGKKACNTTGTATDDGFPEHEFNWNVATKVRDELEKRGARVIMSRDSNDGVGPCVDERGKFADEADFLVSIHANGSTDSSIRGFGVILAPGEKVEESTKLAEAIVRGFKDHDFPINRAGYGKDGMVERTDLAGLNHASVPAVIVECGEMRNPEEAERMQKDPDAYARALVDGIDAFASYATMGL